MADILSTLRELRSLEEKQAHGTLTPGEEQRFQELQAIVSSRGPKPGPPTPVPVAPGAPLPVAAPAPIAAAPAADTEPPFVDADLTEDATVVAAAPELPPESPPVPPPEAPNEALLIDASSDQAPPNEAPLELAPPPPQVQEVPQGQEPQEVPQVPAAPQAPQAQVDKPVPMSPAELRQWNATFTPPEAPPQQDPTVVSAAPPAAWEPPTPITAAEPEALIPAVEEPTSVFSEPPPEPLPMPGDQPPAATAWLTPTPLPDPLEGFVPAAQEALPEPSPESTVIAVAPVDDAPAVWSDPNASPNPTGESLAVPAHEDGWTASVSWSAGIPPPELLPPEVAPAEAATSDMEPTRLAQASSLMDPTLADSFEPPPVQRSSDFSSGVTSKRMTPIGEAFAAGESRVVVHMLGGLQKRGSLVDAHMNADFLELRLPDGEREMLSTAALKAVFFVVPIGQDVPKPVGDPVTVTLQDGHQLTGLSPDYQVGAVGFFLCPTDQRSRTAKIYIYAGAVKGIS